jgi:hypothetical protein
MERNILFTKEENLEREIVKVETIIEDMDLNPRADLNEIKKTQNKLSLLKKELTKIRGKNESTFNF